MLFKLSKRNVQKSVKDYSIYFLTLVLGVCIFYVFNSIEAQTVMMDISQSKKEFIGSITKIISVVSVFISFVLGFLIIYANNFIIKKRNREFGIYMTLGISRSKISFMLFFETVVIGIIALVVGLFVGVFLSQGLATVTASLFEVDMKKYTFVFSKDACIKTTVYFSIMFFITMLLNFIVVSRYKLINLINSQRRSESLKSTNLILSVVLFILSIVCLGTAYKLILDNALIDIADNKFKLSILLGVVGTVLFFRSLAGFLVKLVQSDKNLYLRNLNTFTLRQLNSKINTNYISMSVICLMLFISIGMYSAAISIKVAMEKSSEFRTPYDMTISEEYIYQEKPNFTNEKLSDMTQKLGFNVKDYSKDYIDYNFYNSPVKFKEMFKNTSDEFLGKQMKVLMDFNIPAMKLSDYNRLSQMQEKKPIDLKDNEVLVITDMDVMKNPVKDYVKNNKNIKIGENEFKVKDDYKYQALESNIGNSKFITLVMADNYVNDYDISKKCLSLNYNLGNPNTEEKVNKNFEQMANKMKKDNYYKNTQIYYITRSLALDINMSTSCMFLYVGIYVGLIFLICSAAVLALNQLSGATESLGRYEILKKLGVSSDMINKSIFIQVLIYFSLPIMLALVHSIFGIKVANNVVNIFGNYDTTGNNIVSIGSICIIYAIYCFGTYRGYKRIVNKNN